ncbi:crossover junction endodeoxyribonuclease RuvC [Catalinimonas niigatensis]|uniref:crossover junction endodeoxyribonuclease RuvC n=1 Tax=Catalinimonas niigatensis TaxID=1397264 RepID=UPI0026652056|nr:crossover junction endodeoxyribonuclease RuvC [Catalinimonas niigatensis]WPP48886.1 crossover junction endodeoxyribonuclease RuvC [Catalinimonas niigatensis]
MQKEDLQEKIILGIDPGTQIMGYGVLMISYDHHKHKQLELLQYGVIRLAKYKQHELKLKKIFDRILGLIDQYTPDEMALEAPFYGKNVQSMLKLGRAQGVAMAAALSRQIPIVEYAPKKVKQSVTGNGNASKEQVAHMLQNLLKFPEQPSAEQQLLDATDALAVALCHHYQKSTPVRQAKSWKAFLADNPDRIKG